MSMVGSISVSRIAQIKAQPEQENQLERLHSSLRETFVSLPGGGSLLTPEQLDAVLGGDRRAIHDIAKLLFQTREIDQNGVE
jgi:hypothetical protein